MLTSGFCKELIAAINDILCSVYYRLDCRTLKKNIEPCLAMVKQNTKRITARICHSLKSLIDDIASYKF